MTSQKEKGIALIPVLVIALFVTALVLADNLKPAKSQQGYVLSSGSGSDGSDDERDDESDDDSSSDNSGSGSSDDDSDDEAEVRVETTDSGVRVRTRTEDDRERTDFYFGETKLRIETRDGQTKVKIEEEDGDENEIEIEDEDEVEFDKEAMTGAVRVSTNQNRFIIRHREIEARTNFPVSVDLETSELIITTPAGEKRVAILPQQAVDNMLAANLFSKVSLDDSGESEVELTTLEDGSVVYEAHGTSTEKLFGLFNVSIENVGTVDAQTGQVLGFSRNFLNQLLSTLSF